MTGVFGNDLIEKYIAMRLVDEPLVLVMLKQTRVEASRQDCQVCGALHGAIMFPALITLDPETLAAAVDDHDHWKYGEVEVFRTAAHGMSTLNSVHVIPDDDQPWYAPEQGSYRIGIYGTDDRVLGWLEIKPMNAGDVLSSLGVKIT